MAERPNVLLFFTDQQRFDTIHALGNPIIRTPNLDRLVHDGVAFTSAYSPSPVCVPARCSLWYGQYPWTTQCYENYAPMPEDGRPSIADALAEAGYRTHGIGKCHFTPERWALRGFQTRARQEELVPDPEEDDYLRHLWAHGFDHLTDPHGVRGEMYYIPQIAQMPARLHPTQWVGDQTLAFLDEAVQDEAPWLCFSSFVHPHPPFCPPAPWHKLYRAESIPMPSAGADDEALLIAWNRIQNRYKWRDQGLDRNLLRVMRAYYYACISFIDYQVGRILDRLTALGQLDNTLILFTSDHGEHLGDRGCFGKRTYQDTCARVPLLARLPGRLEGGARCDRPASLVDVMPTILDACGAGSDRVATDGVDLAALAKGAPEAERPAVYSQHFSGPNGTYTAVTARWKYVYSAIDDKELLFDRVGDPGETRNHAGVCSYREPLALMRGQLIAALRAGGEEAALEGDGFRYYPPRQRPRREGNWRAYDRPCPPADPDTGLLVQDHPWADHAIPGYITDHGYDSGKDGGSAHGAGPEGGCDGGASTDTNFS